MLWVSFVEYVPTVLYVKWEWNYGLHIYVHSTVTCQSLKRFAQLSPTNTNPTCIVSCQSLLCFRTLCCKWTLNPWLDGPIPIYHFSAKCVIYSESRQSWDTKMRQLKRYVTGFILSSSKILHFVSSATNNNNCIVNMRQQQYRHVGISADYKCGYV